jgi:hypothetical protein
MARPVALAVGCGAGRLRLSLPAAGGGRDLLLQRLAAQRRVGRLHDPLVRTLLRRRRDAAAAANSLLIAIVARSRPCSAPWPAFPCSAGEPALLPFLVLTPVAMPEILLGVSLLLFFRQVLDLTLGLISILIAHITFSIGFVAIIVRARLAGMDESIFEAARDLGATRGRPSGGHPAADPAGHRGRLPDELHAVDRRFRHHLLRRRRRRHHAAAADLLDDQGGRDARKSMPFRRC